MLIRRKSRSGAKGFAYRAIFFLQSDSYRQKTPLTFLLTGQEPLFLRLKARLNPDVLSLLKRRSA
jgi:hypothetical protein